ncbi:hypothetical protein [Novosphingobium sp.]|uniref:hypothetical protein n=1 Tax=Novosphingobium sp. TaxID=1874826 RepID=UPI00286E4146|nr:hypothetical protein [Novosphingobium sp.]
MLTTGAPPMFAIVNAVAALLALVIAAVLYRKPSRKAELAALCLAPVALAASIAIGPDIDGVHRWVAIGPLRLHAAALFGPSFLVAFQRRADWFGTAVAVVMAGLVTLQPDMGAALALACALGIALVFEFRWDRLMAFAVSAIAFGVTAIRPDRLEPVSFVENVLQNIWHQGSVLALLIPLALLAAIAAPVLMSAGRRSEGAALAGWFLGLAAASLLGPFPTPLIGYGAAPILGYGIALGLLGRARPNPAPSDNGCTQTGTASPYARSLQIERAGRLNDNRDQCSRNLAGNPCHAGSGGMH